MNTTEVAIKESPAEVANAALKTIDPTQFVEAVYSPFHARLANAIAETSDIEYDITTTAGMEVAKKCRATFRDIRIEADKERAARKAPLLVIGKLLESKNTEIEVAVAPHEEKYDAQIKAEDKRKEDIKAEAMRIETLRLSALDAKVNIIKEKALAALNLNADDTQAMIVELQAIEATEENYQERYVEVELLLSNTIKTLEQLVVGKRATEQAAAQQAQLAREQQAQAAEKSRVDDIKTKIQAIKNYLFEGMECESSVQLNALIEKLDGIEVTEGDFAEFTTEAKEAQSKALQALHRHHATMFKAEEAAEVAVETPINQSQIIAPEPAKQEAMVDVVSGFVNASVTAITGMDLSTDKDLTATVNTQYFKGVTPSAAEIVCALAATWKVNEEIAHAWLVNTDFKVYKKAA
jgi:hypothetical protein